MHEQFEFSGFHVTTDPDFMDEQNQLTPHLKREINNLFPQISSGNKTVIRKLKKLIERYPENPQLKNYLSVAYNAAGRINMMRKINEWICKDHPDYLFGVINEANLAISDNKLEKVPELIGEKLDLKALYPEREVFHLSEVTSFFKLLVSYYTTKGDIQKAEEKLRILTEIAPEHYDTKEAERLFLMQSMESGFERLKEMEKSKIKVKVKGTYHDIQTREKPVFIHPETEWLYQYGVNIEKEKLERLLALPRATLIQDLQTVLKDIIRRYQYFRELDGAGELSEHGAFFGCHAVFLLGELEASEALDDIMETLKQDNDFLFFWYFDLLTEDFWDPILKTGSRQIKKLKEFILTPHIDTYARQEVANALSQIALHYPERRKEILDCLESIMDVIIEANPASGLVDSVFNGFLVSDVLSLRATDLMGKIEQLYQKGYVAEGVVGSLDKIKGEILKEPGFNPKKELSGIFERYEKLQKIANKIKSFKKENEVVPSIGKPVTSSPKVGRNDPCPCGSGKKYKKCCWNK